MGSTPGKIVFRVIGIAVIAACIVAALGFLVVAGMGAARWLAGGALLILLVGGGYFAWIFLPDVDLPGRSPRRGPPATNGRPRVAITFDDGPNGEVTIAILDALRRHNARATFFVVGDAVRCHPELVRRMFDDGHVVGSHTDHHTKLPWLSARELARELDGAAEAIVAAGAPAPRWFRAPHGFKSPHLPSALKARQLRMVAWTHGVWDTDRPSADVIAERAIGCLSDGEILLLHDGTLGADRTQTAAALDRILAAAAARGLDLVTLPEMFEPHGRAA